MVNICSFGALISDSKLFMMLPPFSEITSYIFLEFLSVTFSTLATGQILFHVKVYLYCLLS